MPETDASVSAGMRGNVQNMQNKHNKQNNQDKDFRQDF